MLRTRVMPCLLLEDEGLVKTVKFRDSTYIGDPINSVRIYNEMGVDELVFLDIRASRLKQDPPFTKIKEIASECFMPIAYGGGIRCLDHAKKLYDIGVEKIVLNTIVHEDPALVSDLAAIYGTQAIVIAMDVKKSLLGNYHLYAEGGAKKLKDGVIDFARKIELLGAGEILLNSITRDGTMEGFDLDLITEVSAAVSIPLISLGGAGDIQDIAKAKNAGASAIGLGSMAVYQNKSRGILINFPDQAQLSTIFELGQ